MGENVVEIIKFCNLVVLLIAVILGSIGHFDTGARMVLWRFDEVAEETRRRAKELGLAASSISCDACPPEGCMAMEIVFIFFTFSFLFLLTQFLLISALKLYPEGKTKMFRILEVVVYLSGLVFLFISGVLMVISGARVAHWINVNPPLRGLLEFDHPNMPRIRMPRKPKQTPGSNETTEYYPYPDPETEPEPMPLRQRIDTRMDDMQVPVKVAAGAICLISALLCVVIVIGLFLTGRKAKGVPPSAQSAMTVPPSDDPAPPPSAQGPPPPPPLKTV